MRTKNSIFSVETYLLPLMSQLRENYQDLATRAKKRSEELGNHPPIFVVDLCSHSRWFANQRIQFRRKRKEGNVERCKNIINELEELKRKIRHEGLEEMKSLIRQLQAINIRIHNEGTTDQHKRSLAEIETQIDAKGRDKYEKTNAYLYRKYQLKDEYMVLKRTNTHTTDILTDILVVDWCDIIQSNKLPKVHPESGKPSWIQVICENLDEDSLKLVDALLSTYYDITGFIFRLEKDRNWLVYHYSHCG